MSKDIGRARGPLTDKSGTAGTSTAKIADANSYRTYFFFQNLDAAIVMYLNFGPAASAGAGSIRVPAGSTFQMDAGSYVSTDQINVIAVSGTPVYTAKEGSD